MLVLINKLLSAYYFYSAIRASNYLSSSLITALTAYWSSTVSALLNNEIVITNLASHVMPLVSLFRRLFLSIHLPIILSFSLLSLSPSSHVHFIDHRASALATKSTRR